MKKYRIIRRPGHVVDEHYRIQVYRWWFPFWVDSSAPLFIDIEEARKGIKILQNPVIK